MTWSHGYFCPICECRWVAHLCKDMLPCGCNVKTNDAVYIHVKKYFGKCQRIFIEYKNFKLNTFIPDDNIDEHAFRLISTVESQLIKKAIHNAIYERSLYDNDWFVRCSKCANFDDGKCTIHERCSIDCSDFKLKPLLFIIDGRIETDKSLDEWLDDFLSWLESRDEWFTGALNSINGLNIGGGVETESSIWKFEFLEWLANRHERFTGTIDLD